MADFGLAEWFHSSVLLPSVCAGGALGVDSREIVVKLNSLPPGLRGDIFVLRIEGRWR